LLQLLAAAGLIDLLCFYNYDLLASSTYLYGCQPSGEMAGALGFEPRSSVLETDSLTVELTPL
jgi:hypothetical protein